MVKLDMEAIRNLPVEDRLALVDEIWSSLASEPEAIPVSESQLAEAKRRLAEHDEDPDSAVSWDEAKKRLRSKA